MPARLGSLIERTETQSVFTGGLFSRRIGTDIPPTCLAQLENFDVTQDGNLVTRLGAIRFSNDIAGKEVVSTFYWQRSDGLRQTLVFLKVTATGKTDIHIADESGQIGAAVGTAFTAGYDFTCAVMQDAVYLTNGVENVQRWDGAALADAGIDGSTPATPTSGAPGATGALPNGITLKYALAYVYGGRGESIIGAASAAQTTTTATQKIPITNIPASPGTGVTLVTIYRQNQAQVGSTPIASNPWEFAGQVTAGTTSFDDTNATYDPGTRGRTVAATPPKTKIIIAHEGVLWYGNQTGNTSRAWWSNFGQPDVVVPTNYRDIAPANGETLNAFGSMTGQLVAFKDRSTFVQRSSIPSQFQFIQVSKLIGASHQKSVQSWEHGIFFSGLRGPHSFDGLTMHPIGDAVLTEMLALRQTFNAPNNRQWAQQNDFAPSGFSNVAATGAYPNGIARDLTAPPDSMAAILGNLTLGDVAALSGVGWLPWKYGGPAATNQAAWNDAQATLTDLANSFALPVHFNGVQSFYTAGRGAAAHDAPLRNGNFEDAGSLRWTVTPKNYSGQVNVQRHSAAQQAFSLQNGGGGTTYNFAADTGTQFACAEFDWVGSSTLDSQARFGSLGVRYNLLDGYSRAVLLTRQASISYNPGGSTAYGNATLLTGDATLTGRKVILQLIAGDMGAGANYLCTFESDPFTYSGADLAARFGYVVLMNAIGTSDRAVLFWDNLSTGRADYSGATAAHSWISSAVQQPSIFTNAANDAKKWIARIEIDYDMPGTGVAGKVGFRLRAYTSDTANFAWSDGSATLDVDCIGSSSEGSGKTLVAYVTNATGGAGANFQMLAKKHARVKINFNTTSAGNVAAPTYTSDDGTTTPIINAVRIYYWTDANYFYSEPLDLGSSASAWGAFNALFTDQASGLPGGSTRVKLWVRTATTLAGLSGTSWGSAVTVPSSSPATFRRFFQWRAQLSPPDDDAGLHVLAYTSQSPTALNWPSIDAVSISWLAGGDSLVSPPASLYRNGRYWIAGAQAGFSYNNVVYVYDAWHPDPLLAGRGPWTKYTYNGFGVSDLVLVKNRVVAGGANLALGRLYVLESTFTDDGLPILARLRLRNFKSRGMGIVRTVRRVQIGCQIEIPTVDGSPGSPADDLGGGGGSLVPLLVTDEITVAAYAGTQLLTTETVTVDVGVLNGGNIQDVTAVFGAHVWGPTVTAALGHGPAAQWVMGARLFISEIALDTLEAPGQSKEN